jgi:ferrous iron transport protein A
LPLAAVGPGSEVKVLEVAGGIGMRTRLAGMGVVAGAKLKVLANDGGPLLVSCGETRLALGRGMAHRILVEQV